MPLKHVNVYCDGGMIGPGNPSPRGVYWSVGVEQPDGDLVIHRGESTFHHTNNEAEWLSLIDSLRRAVRMGPARVTVHMDSQLVVRQFSGRYNCNSPRLIPLRDCARSYLPDLDSAGVVADVVWVSRKEIARRLGH